MNGQLVQLRSQNARKQCLKALESYTSPPLARSGMKIGLLGGSFDPPHQGHVHISKEALKRLQLDQLWWLVSPGNPLKERGPWPLRERIRQCCEIVDHPRLRITAFEAALGSPYTVQTLNFLTRRFPATHFVWLMGADNMIGIDHWQNWQQIFRTVPVAVLDRPGDHYRLNSSRAAQLFAPHRLKERAAAALPMQKPPCWCRLSVPLHHARSTNIRARHAKTRPS